MQFENLGNLDNRLVAHGAHLVVNEVQRRQRGRLLPRVLRQVRPDAVLQVLGKCGHRFAHSLQLVADRTGG